MGGSRKRSRVRIPPSTQSFKIQILDFPSNFKNDVLGFKLFFVRKRFTGIFALK